MSSKHCQGKLTVLNIVPYHRSPNFIASAFIFFMMTMPTFDSDDNADDDNDNEHVDDGARPVIHQGRRSVWRQQSSAKRDQERCPQCGFA